MTRFHRSVVHIGTADRSGGAARAAYRLHKGLKAMSWDSRMLVSFRVTAGSDVELIRRNWRWKALDRATALVLGYAGVQDLWYASSARLHRHPSVEHADVIQLHNLHGLFFDIPSVARLSRRRPTVWLLHDMWPITGHCVYSYGCERWRSGCGDCPLLKEDHLRLRYDTTALHWKLKDEVYSRSKLQIVAPSNWLYQLAKDSPLLGRFPVHHIPYGIETDQYCPIDKETARRLLGVDPHARVLLFSAHVIGGNTRKGAQYLPEMLERLSQAALADIQLLTLGLGGDQLTQLRRFNVRELGFVTDDLLIALAFSAADIFVMPTIADNLPLTILESLACGTPVVAFDVGGVSSAVKHMETGYLARCGDVSDLTHGVRTLLVDTELRTRLSRGARKLACDAFALDVQARKYVELYESLLEAPVL